MEGRQGKWYISSDERYKNTLLVIPLNREKPWEIPGRTIERVLGIMTTNDAISLWKKEYGENNGN